MRFHPAEAAQFEYHPSKHLKNGQQRPKYMNSRGIVKWSAAAIIAIVRPFLTGDADAINQRPVHRERDKVRREMRFLKLRQRFVRAE